MGSDEVVIKGKFYGKGNWFGGEERVERKGGVVE